MSPMGEHVLPLNEHLPESMGGFQNDSCEVSFEAKPS